MAPKPNNAAPGRITPEEVARNMKREYDFAARDQFDKSLDVIQKHIEELSRPDLDIKNLVEFTVKMIYRQFHIKEVSIGLKSESDGLFRYVTMMGMRANVWTEHQKLTYDQDSLFDEKVYKFTNISKYSKLFLAENEPYDADEKGTYSEHLMSSSKRRHLDDSIEGDYLDMLILNGRGQLSGWIEVNGTWEGKLPTVNTIKCLEVVASLIGVALSLKPYG